MSETNGLPKISNRPGLSALSYRIGDYSAFRNYLLAQLSQVMPNLKTRDSDDSAIALLDTWSVVADVLTFYQERIANEGYLNTATERQSLIELARLIGYELKPGVSASTHLAFTLDDKLDGSPSVTIPKGTQVMSIPGEGELPQIFETSEDLLTVPVWNALKPRLTKPQDITCNTRQLYLEGANTQLATGDWLLLTGTIDQTERAFLLALKTVEPDPVLGTTLISWDYDLQDADLQKIPADTWLYNPHLFAFRQQAGLFGNHAPRWEATPDELKRKSLGVELQGGVFATRLPGSDVASSMLWQSQSAGLPNQDILCLTAYQSFCFAGTEGSGIFRLQQNKTTWQSVNQGLTNLNVQALYVMDSVRGYLLAGTLGGGVFRSKDNGETWSPINVGSIRLERDSNHGIVNTVNTGIPNSVVRSLLAYRAGDTLFIFAGTDDDIYRTTNQGQDWSSSKIPESSHSSVQEIPYRHLKGLPNHVIYSLIRTIGANTITGEVSNVDVGAKTITVKDANAILEKDALIFLKGKSYKVKESIKEAQLQLDGSFPLEVISQKFKVLDQVKGKIREARNQIIKVIDLNDVLYAGNEISVEISIEGETRVVKQRIEKILSYPVHISEIDEKLTADLIECKFETDSRLFTGTDQGIYYSTDHGEKWDPLVGDLTNQSVFSLASYEINGHSHVLAGTSNGIRCCDASQSPPTCLPAGGSDTDKTLDGKAVRSLQVTALNNKLYAIAATNEGVFLGQEKNNIWTWHLIGNNSIVKNITSVAVCENSVESSEKKILAGAKFSGFTEVENEPKEWPNFYIQNNQIDLDTLYPKIMPDSWVVLLNQTQKFQENRILPTHLPVKVEQVSIEQRQGFTLDTKVTRLLASQTIQKTANFNPRSTIVLANSEALPLAQVSLAVTVQQQQVFQDPIWDNKIFLNQYVHGLEAKKKLIVSGKHLRARVNAGGVFQSKNWSLCSTNLIESKIQMLACREADGTLFASTKSAIYQSFDHGQTWEKLVDAPPEINHLEKSGINFLFIDTQPGNRSVQGKGKNVFSIQISELQNNTNELQEGDFITIKRTQTRIIKKITPKRETRNQAQARREVIEIDRPLDQIITPTTDYSISRLFIISQNKIFRLDSSKEEWTELESSKKLIDLKLVVKVLAIHPVNKQLFIGTDAGVFTFTDNQWMTVGSPELKEINALGFSKESSSGIASLFATTINGELFRKDDDAENWDNITQTAQNQALRDAQVSCLTIDSLNGYLFVSTKEQGISRSTDNGETWIPISAGISHQAIKSLTIHSYKQALFALTEKGIFHSTSHGQNWEKPQWENIGRWLIRAGVQAIAFYYAKGCLHLFAGSKAGVFYSANRGAAWEAVNQGLRNLEIQALLIVSANTSNATDFQSELDYKIFAGTREGLFLSTNQGKTWEEIKLNLIRPNVRALVSHANHSLFAAIDKQGVFRSLNQGRTWEPLGLTKQNVQTLYSWKRSPTAGSSNYELFVGTAGAGVWRSQNDGATWEQWLSIRLGIGTISSSGLTVEGKQTQFQTQLRVGDKIEADSQIRTVVAISAQQTLIVDTAFKPALKANSFVIHTGLDNLYITALSQRKHALVVGTAGSGVYQTEDNGQHWQEINQGLHDLEIRCLQFNPNTGDLYAGTATGGVFCLAKDSDRWETINTGLVNTDVRTIRIQSENIYIGGIGILSSLDGLDFVELQADDLLRVVTAPIKLQPDPKAVIMADDQTKEWHVLNRNNFKGKLITMQDEDIQLESAVETDPNVSEIAIIHSPPTDEQYPILLLEEPLKQSYDPTTVKVYANVVEATHGETVSEILGSGNGAIANQHFTLSKPPLSHIADSSPRGSKSELKVYVNEVRWTEVSSLYPLDKQDRSYLLRIEDDGTTTITFGDGQRGARLPSGRENITATYRSGIGTVGNIEAGRISLKKTGPASIQGVINPLPATGGAAGEALELARSTIPATTRTLGRIVSRRDFQDFTQAFAGIGKAEAVVLWNGTSELIHITIAGVNGEVIQPDSALHQNLVAAIAAARDPVQQVQISSFIPLLFKLEARVMHQAGYQADKVELAIRQKLLSTFAFEQRAFGQAVTQSEVIAAIQSVSGVQALDLDYLHRQDASRTLQSALVAMHTMWDDQMNQVKPAQLLLLRPAGITLIVGETL